MFKAKSSNQYGNGEAPVTRSERIKSLQQEIEERLALEKAKAQDERLGDEEDYSKDFNEFVKEGIQKKKLESPSFEELKKTYDQHQQEPFKFRWFSFGSWLKALTDQQQQQQHRVDDGHIPGVGPEEGSTAHRSGTGKHSPFNSSEIGRELVKMSRQFIRGDAEFHSNPKVLHYAKASSLGWGIFATALVIGYFASRSLKIKPAPPSPSSQQKEQQRQ